MTNEAHIRVANVRRELRRLGDPIDHRVCGVGSVLHRDWCEHP